MPPWIFFSLNTEHVGECCKVQWVCIDQRIALKVIYYYIGPPGTNTQHTICNANINRLWTSLLSVAAMEFPSNSRCKTVRDQKLSATTLGPPTCPAAACGRPSSAWPGRGIEPATHAGTPAGCVAGSDGWAWPPGEVAGSPPEWRWSTGEERCAGASGPAPETTQLLWCPPVEEERGAGWGEDVVLLGVWFSWNLASLWVHVCLFLFFILLLF